MVRLVLVCAVLIAVVSGGVLLYRSNVLAVERLVVTGNAEVTVDEVIETAAVPDDATLLRFPGSDVEERLLLHPWIADVRVRRNLPDGMTIHIVERTPAAFIDTGDATLWLIDAQGFVIDSRIPAPEDDLVVIRDLDGIAPVVGQGVDSPLVANALDVLAGISQELRSTVRAVSAPAIDRTALITTDDVEVLVGSADDIELKDAVARSILAEQAGRAVYVNVRTPERPTWRGLDTLQ